MFDLFILVGMMVGFMLSSLYLWQLWQNSGKEIWQGVGALSLFKRYNAGQRDSPSITREELESQYIQMMFNQDNELQELDTIETLERGEGLPGYADQLSDASNLKLPEGGSNMDDNHQIRGIELVKVPVVIGENTTQQMLVTDLCLNYTAIKVRDIDACVRDLTATVISDKVIVQGILHKQIFFVDVKNVVRHQHENIPFSFFVDVPGAEPGMDVQIHPIIEHIKTELLMNNTVLHQKVVIEFFVKVTETQQIFVEIGDGPLTKLERVIGENSVQTLIANQLELPVKAIKVVDIDAEVCDINCEVIEDKVIIQGIVHKQIFFIDTDDVERHVCEDVSFSTFVDVPGAEPGNNCQVHPSIEFIKQELICDGKVLSQEVILEIFVKITETVQLNLVLGEDILLKVPEVIGENLRQILLENIVQLPVPAIKIKEIDATVVNIQTTVIRNKVIIQGIVHKQIFFVDEENVERHLGENVPFSTFVDVAGAEPGMQADVTPIIEFVKPELCPGSDQLTQKVVIELFVKVTQITQINVPAVGPYGCACL